MLKNKKLFSATMAAAMALSLAIPASAAAVAASYATTNVSTANSKGLYSSDVNVGGDTKIPSVKVTVPTAGGIAVNPYKLKYEIDGSNYTEQIVSLPQYITNESDVPVSITATVTGAIPDNSKATFVTSAPTEKITTKAVYMYFECLPTKDDSTAPTWATSYDKAKHILLNLTGTTLKNFVTMDAKDGTNAYAAYHFVGSVATNPSEAWASTDIVNATIAFTFTPQVTASTTP